VFVDVVCVGVICVDLRWCYLCLRDLRWCDLRRCNRSWCGFL
jgi:hypothetical protein